MGRQEPAFGSAREKTSPLVELSKAVVGLLACVQLNGYSGLAFSQIPWAKSSNTSRFVANHPTSIVTVRIEA